MAAELQHEKDPLRQWLGKKAKAMGKQFESLLDESFAYYDETGFACIEKTPEPMKPIKDLGNGKFIACYEKKAQPDYKGTVKGGRSVMFEAKFTSTERMEQSRVTKGQTEYMNKHQKLGARCYVVIGFATGNVYRFLWDDWCNMKTIFGRKYVMESDNLQQYKVRYAWNGKLILL